MDSKKLLQLFSKTILSLALLVMMGFQTASAQSTIYVSSTNGSSSFNGTATTNTSGINGPKQTLAQGLAIASDGDTISIEAGAYATESFNVNKAVTIVVRAAIGAPSITTATFSGGAPEVVINPGSGKTVTFNSGTGTVSTNATAFTLTSGTLALGTGKLAFSATPVAVTVTGGTVTGSSPGYADVVNVTYTQTGTTAKTAGKETPANLGGGSLTVSAGHTPPLTFSGVLVTGPVAVSATGASASVTFTGALTATSVTTSGAAARAFAAVTVTAGFNHAGTGTATAASIAAGTSSVDVTSTGTLNVTGAVSLSAPGAGSTIAAGGTLSAASIAVGGTLADNAADEEFTTTLDNAGTLTVSGAITSSSVTDTGTADPIDTDTFVLDFVNSGTATVGGAASLAAIDNSDTATFTGGATVTGNLDNTDTVTFGAATSVAGVVNNTDTVALGSNTLTLSGDAAHTALGTVTGATSTVAVTGDADVNGIDTAGHLNISGDGGITAASTVDGNLTISGDGDVAADTEVGGWASLSGDNDVSGVLEVTGAATFAGLHVVSSAGNMVGGAATFSGDTTVTGDLEIGSGTIGALGSLDITGATLTSHGDFTSGTGGTFAAGTLAFDLDGNATFQPGPNTTVDDLTVTGAFTLTLGQTVFITTSLGVDLGSTVALGDFLIRMNGAVTTAMVDGSLTTDSGQSGTLAFEGGGAHTLTGLGEMSNILVNNAGVAVDIGATTEIDFTGTLSLVDGGINVIAGGDISPSGTSAEVSRNLANAGTTVAGSFNGDDENYILTVYGAAAAAGSEFAATGITTLNVEDSAVYTTAIAAEVGDVNVDDTSELANGGTLTVSGAIDNEGLISGSDVEITGASSAHSNTGAITSDVYVLATGVTMAGTTNDSFAASLGNLFVGDSVTPTAGSITITNIQEINGDVMIDENGWASVGLAGDDGVVATVGSGNEGTVDGNVSVADGGTAMWTTDATIDGDVSGVGVSTFNFNGNTISMDVGSDFDTEDEAVFGTSGTLEFEGAGTLGTEGAVLPGLTANTGTVALNSDVAVSGTTTIEDTAIIDTGAFNLDVAGAVALDATTSGGVTGSMSISGTTVTLASDYTVTGSLEIDATSVAFAAGDTTDDWAFEVTGGYTQTAGAVSLTNVDLYLTGGVFDFTAGTYTAASDDDSVIFDGSTLDTNDGVLSIPNVEVLTFLEVEADDTLTVTNGLTLSDDLVVLADGTLNIDGPYVLANGGNGIEAVDGTIAWGNAAGLTIEYDGTAATGDENPGTFDTLVVTTTVILSDDHVVNTAMLNDPVDNSGSDLTITDGGTLYVNVDGALADDVILAGAYNLTYDGATITTDESWIGSPALTTVASDVLLDTDRSTVGLTTDTGATFDLDGNTLTVTGDVTNSGAIINGPVAFGGTTTLTGGLALDAVTIAGAVTLVGGDLDVAGTCPGAVLTLTSGVITTGDNAVIICHTDTGIQGFSRPTGGAVVFGNVEKDVDKDMTTPNRVEFPTGDGMGNYRPFAVTFNTISQLGTTVTLRTAYNESNPDGLNGFPISALDDLGNEFFVSRYTTDFHWRVAATPSITPNIDYDVEYRAQGFANFSSEDIERTRAIRRQAGNTDNFWIKVANGAADNDNYAVSATEPVMVARNAVGAINIDGVLFGIGLEQNLAGATAAVSMNAGSSKTLTVASMVSGGSPPYSITYTGDDGVATASDDGTTITVAGVGAGSTAISVLITDSFGGTATGTINATVNAAFAAGTALADLDAVLVGAADATVDASGMTSGGTAPIVYTIDAGTDAAVATATIDAATGEVTVSYGTPGSTTFTVTATDAEGDVVTDDFTASVAAAAGANGTLANQTVNNGAAGAAQDLSAEFTGTGPFTYAASSSDDDVATAATDDTAETVTATGVSPYVVVSGAVTADAAPATITVTATDAFGSMVSSTFDVEVNPVLGNVDGSGGSSPASASLALDAFLGLTTLTAKQTTAADYNADASVTPFDAALIFDAWLNPTPGAASKKEFAAYPASDVAFGEVNMQVAKVTIPVTLTGDQASAVSFSFETSINAEFASVTAVTGTIEGWTVRHFVGEDGMLRIAGFGFEAIPSDGVVANISLELVDAGAEFTLRGQGAVNNNPATDIEGVDVVELPENFALLGNYPNPFNPSTNISFDLPASADVSIEVYDMLGRRVMVLPMQTMQAGSKRSVQLNASQLASGSYFYRVIAQMESKTQVDNGRMLLIK